ncbi:hypothetical protein [Paraurantiacibacter namhicola]|uniref:PepSY domain-containing protein n=1 Tax=Paraurantiacibacter namhicola TaxID=645517 RepID=A0A1C7D8F2_9SPHN|nr:hypothetical protein [Paraurantiacibacter namhicola]ANU07601.1 hypothetical protein A6F65_01295 [Paraurantiacibacter namhicola]
MRTYIKYALLAAATATAGQPALAEKADQLVDINGSYGRDAESALQARGFQHTSTHKQSNGYVYSYWWDASDRSCVTVETYDGRVQTITDAGDGDCGHHRVSGGEVLGAVAGAALIGVLATHKSHHHDDDKHHEDRKAEQDYERGYTDGLHNASYHNYDRSDAYSSGYQAGVDERNANLSHHHNRGGYASVARIDDLRDARAAGGMTELEARGFRQVDNFTSGDTRYSIQYNSATRQCVQVTIADGRFYDIRDIGSNPKCR